MFWCVDEIVFEPPAEVQQARFTMNLWFQMKWTDVVQDCTKAVELNPRYVKALFRRAKALEKLDNKKECLEGEPLFLKMFLFKFNSKAVSLTES